MESCKRPDTMERITTASLADAFIDEQVQALKKQVGDKKVLLALFRRCGFLGGRRTAD